jgi:hypothetical protein
MKRILLVLTIAAVMVLMLASQAFAQGPPKGPPSPNSSHACVYHVAPGTIGFPRAPFCPV